MERLYMICVRQLHHGEIAYHLHMAATSWRDCISFACGSYVMEGLHIICISFACGSYIMEGLHIICISFACGSYIMEGIALVVVGAENLVESGGILNKIGTYTIAMAAKAYNKPLYVMAESLKYMEYYPIQQDDIPASIKVCQTLFFSSCSTYCSTWILLLLSLSCLDNNTHAHACASLCCVCIQAVSKCMR